MKLRVVKSPVGVAVSLTASEFQSVTGQAVSIPAGTVNAVYAVMHPVRYQLL